MKPRTTVVSSQASWVVRNDCIELSLTQIGGHMAPVTFYRNTSKPVQPYHVSPWQNEKHKIDEPVLRPLRGDFFCLPFGGNAAEHRGQKHPVHGESAGGHWHFDDALTDGPVGSMTLSMKYKACPGKVIKTLSLVDGHNVVYCRHVLEGFSGKMPVGHHACLVLPEQEASVLVSTSPTQFGMTCPVAFGDPGAGEYQSLAIAAKFKDLQKVPVAWAGAKHADCSTFPPRKGFDDLLAVFNKPTRDPAWVTAVNVRDGYLWFALKDSKVLPTTAFWISSSGRYAAPWLGRNRCLGLEDCCAYFAEGLADSAKPNVLTKAGIKTALSLSAANPTTVNYIQGAAKIPSGFGRVKAVRFEPGVVTFTDAAGQSVAAPVNWDFLSTGDPNGE